MLRKLMNTHLPTLMKALDTPLPAIPHYDPPPRNEPVVRFIQAGQNAPDGCKHLNELNYDELCLLRGALDMEKNWKNR